jgi:cytochrome P450
MTPLRHALNDPDFYLDDVDEAYRRLRAEAPVYRCAAAGFWALSKYADVDAVSRNPQLFCSSQGVVVNDPMRDGTMTVAPPSIIYMDPPAHVRYRRLVSKAFTPRMVKTLEPAVRDIARRTVEAIVPGTPVDFVEEVAVPLPMLVIADMLGVPTRDRAQFKHWSDEIVAGADQGVQATMGVMQELFGYFMEVLSARRSTLEQDLISALAFAEVDGERLSDEEILMFCMTLLVAGNETTRNLISGGALALMRFPDERRRLVAEPELLPRAIDEMLRWVTPVKTFARTASRDTVIRGQPIAAGDYLVLLYASANRDEEVWGPAAERFDVARMPGPGHLAFGIGQHSCLGANLALLESRALFEALLARFPDFELAGDVTRVRSTIMNGIAQMPVVFPG